MIVLDSSAALAWALDDEQGLGPDLLETIAIETGIVPTHWVLEVANGLRMAARRNRLQLQEPPEVLERIRCLPLQIDYETPARGWLEIPALAQQYNLTTYDAAYLELALRLGIPLATLDQSLARAARAAQASLFQ